MDDDKAFDECFEINTLNALKDSILALLDEKPTPSPADFLVKLEEILVDFNTTLTEPNPRRTVVNFLDLEQFHLAYFWNLSRRLGSTGVVSWDTIFENYREVNHCIIYSKYKQGEQGRRRDLAEIDGDFTALMQLDGDL
jgi:hypothetical protein